MWQQIIQDDKSTFEAIAIDIFCLLEQFRDQYEDPERGGTGDGRGAGGPGWYRSQVGHKLFTKLTFSGQIAHSRLKR